MVEGVFSRFVCGSGEKRNQLTIFGPYAAVNILLNHMRGGNKVSATEWARG